MSIAPRVRARVLSRRGLLERLAVASGSMFAGGVALPACAPGDEPATGLTADGTVPPVTPNAEFYVTSCCGTPVVDRATWTLAVTIDGAEVARTDWDGLLALPGVTLAEREHTLECIGAGPYNLAIGNAIWTVATLRSVLDGLGVTVPADTLELRFTSADDYSTSVPVGDLDRIHVAVAMNGEPLPAAHGFPARLLVPGRYGMKNPKWLVGIDLASTASLGFWETRGWSNDATYRLNALVLSPTRLDFGVEAGPVRVLGSAFAGSDPVVRVEASVDGGAWTDVVIDYAPGADVWTLWHLDVDLAPGTHTVRVRAASASGATTGDTEGSDPLSGYDGGMELQIEAV